MGKDVGKIYQHSQYQLSTSSYKAPVNSYSASETLSSIELTTASIFSVRDKNQNNSVLSSQNTIQNDARITNNYDIQSCETTRKQNYKITTTSNLNHNAQSMATTSASMLNLHTTTALPPVGKEYMCFQKDGKTVQDARCIESRVTTKAIDYVLSIDKFEQPFFVLKGMLQSPRLKNHVHTIGIYQSLRNNPQYEHKCLENKQTIIQTCW